jgi:geranylgeranyl diphosphate synthase, type I
VTGALRSARPPVPASLARIAETIEARVSALLDDEAARWELVDADLGDPVRFLRDLVLAGGKRLRPAFCHWAYVGAGGTDHDLLVDVGAALELLHAFALIHDDVMDGSDRRRGRSTTHRAFGDRHHAAEWRGESRRFGEGVAILVGDVAFVYADQLLDGVDATARRVWDELRIELNVGQYLDMLGTARGDADLTTARRIATYKSGKYTVERPLHLGAAMAGRLEELGAPLSAYGLPLGEAFQLRDDLLGVFGDASAIGKPVGDDLREGKPTPLLALARDRVDPAGARVLDRVGDPGLTADDIDTIRQAIAATGAVEEVERRIAALTEESLLAIEQAPLLAEARLALTELAAYVAWRDR